MNPLTVACFTALTAETAAEDDAIISAAINSVTVALVAVIPELTTLATAFRTADAAVIVELTPLSTCLVIAETAVMLDAAICVNNVAVVTDDVAVVVEDTVSGVVVPPLAALYASATNARPFDADVVHVIEGPA